MIKLRVIRNTRAKGAFVGIGEIMDESNSDLATMKEIHAAGKGEWVSTTEQAPEAQPVAEPEPVGDEDTDSEPEQAAPKRRGRKPKQS